MSGGTGIRSSLKSCRGYAPCGFDAHLIDHFSKAVLVFNGSTLDFQSKSVGSNPTYRSKLGGSQYKVNGETHYARNKQSYINKASQRRRYLSQYLWRVKRFCGCKDCGIKDPRVLEFDHIKAGKTMNPTMIRSSGWGMAKVKTELRLCEVVCANCHRLRTYTRRH